MIPRIHLIMCISNYQCYLFIFIGTVVNVTFDNLGGNSSLGFSESFNATFYCRSCLMQKNECQQATAEDITKYRNRENYSAAMKTIEESESVDIKETEGYKFYCHLNNLKFFHTVDNFSFDIFHDIYEGTGPFLVENLINLCVKAKVFTYDDITSYIHFFDYGRLNQNNIPITLSIGSKSLGQNASQMRCLMLHLPFIFYDFKGHKKVRELWEIVSSMLEIMRIVHSADLFTKDLLRLRSIVSTHLLLVIYLFKAKLLPKHHYMTHYATAIEMIGPLIHLSTMRYESYNKNFTSQANKTNNFVNIGHSIALKHQQLNSLKTNYGDMVSHAKLKAISSDSQLHSVICQHYRSAAPNVLTTDRAKINSDLYLKKLFLIHDNHLWEINEILSIDDNFHFLCHQFEIIEFDSFLQSVKIKLVEPIMKLIIKHSELKIRKSFERKKIGKAEYIVVDTMEIQRLMELHLGT